MVMIRYIFNRVMNEVGELAFGSAEHNGSFLKWCSYWACPPHLKNLEPPLVICFFFQEKSALRV